MRLHYDIPLKADSELDPDSIYISVSALAIPLDILKRTPERTTETAIYDKYSHFRNRRNDFIPAMHPLETTLTLYNDLGYNFFICIPPYEWGERHHTLASVIEKLRYWLHPEKLNKGYFYIRIKKGY